MPRQQETNKKIPETVTGVILINRPSHQTKHKINPKQYRNRQCFEADEEFEIDPLAE